jgi:hypothetical protein
MEKALEYRDKTMRAQANQDYLWATTHLTRQHLEASGQEVPAMESVISRAGPLVAAEREKQIVGDGRGSAYDEVNNPSRELVRLSADKVSFAQDSPDVIHAAGKQSARLLLEAAALLVAELDRLLDNGTAFCCDRCGRVYDSTELEPVRNPVKLYQGEANVCKACDDGAKAEADADAGEEAARAQMIADVLAANRMRDEGGLSEKGEENA